MRRLAVAFVTLLSTAVFTACGDTGDHFGEFRQAPGGPVTANKIQATMPVVPGRRVASAKLPLYVTAYTAAGTAVQIGTNLTNPIIITTNYLGFVTFSSPTGPAGATYKHLSLQAAPPAITVYYRKPPGITPCKKGEPPAVVTVYNHDANPQFVTVNLSDCGTTNPSSRTTTHRRPA